MGLLSALYHLGLACRTFAYKQFKTPGRLPVKVISVGNITLGGTGKTPAVIKLAEEAVRRGFSPCILTRGYKGKKKETCFVSDGKHVLLNPADAGDEAFLMAKKLIGIPVVKGGNRYEAGMYALHTLDHKPDLMILDDGFQHIALERDIDVVLIDGTNPFGNEKLFPEGGLREPLHALKRSDFIIITKSDQADEDTYEYIRKKVRSMNPEGPLYKASHRPAGLVDITGEKRELGYIEHKKVYAFAGIANTEHFKATLKECGAEVSDVHRFRDHHAYKERDLEKIKQLARDMDIITTEKDLVKLQGMSLPDNLFALTIDFSIENKFLNDLFRRIQ